LKPIIIFLFIFLFTFCSVLQTYNYEIKLDDENKKNYGRLTIDVVNNSIFNDSLEISFQFYPNSLTLSESYVLTFDMKFREDYESDFDGVCIGPTWNANKSGNLKVLLNKENNFKSRAIANFDSINDRCTKYIYYLRFLEANIETEQKILFGVATDYAELYPDAPNYWVVNKNNEIEKIGTSNIKKYSIYFELSK
jgi:hypothetical protein